METAVPVFAEFKNFEFTTFREGIEVSMKLIPVFTPAKKVPLGIVRDAETKKMYVLALIKADKKGKFALEELVIPESEEQPQAESATDA